MLTIQEQEERDFDPQSDFMNALAMSRMTKPASDVIPDDGRFHVYTEFVYFCPSTDATAGTVKTLVDSFDTYAEAEACADYLSKEAEGDDDFWVAIYPQPVVDSPVPEIPENDIPF